MIPALFLFVGGCAPSVEEQRAKALKIIVPVQQVDDIAKKARDNQTRCRYREIPSEKTKTADSLLTLAQQQHTLNQFEFASLNYDRAALMYELVMREVEVASRDEHVRRLEKVILDQTEAQKEHERLVQKVKTYEEVIEKLESTWKKR